MSVYTKKQSKGIIITAIIIIGLFLLYSLSPLFDAILASFIIYILFKPLFIYLIEKYKMKRVWSVILIIAISFLIIIIPAGTFTYLLIDKILYFQENPETINEVLKSFETALGRSFDHDVVNETVKSAGNWIIGLFPEFLNTTMQLTLTIGMMYFFLYFMYTRYEKFEAAIIKYMPFRGRNSAHFVEEFRNMTYSSIVAQGIVSLAQGILLGLGFVIFNIPYPVFWGVVCFFVSFLPVVGSAAVFVPAGIVEIVSGNSFNGIGILIFGFIAVGNVDNLLRMWLNNRLGNIHPLITITGIFIGLPLFGILGLVFGPLLISTFILLIKMYEAAYSDNVVEKERVVKSRELVD